MIIRIDATLPNLTTRAELGDLRGETRTDFINLRGVVTTGFAELRAELADKPGKVFLAAAIGVLLAAYAAGLAGVAALPVMAKLWP